MTSTSVLVLALAAERPSGPYEMIKVLERVNIRRWNAVSDSSIYLALKKLEARGLLAGTPVREGNRPEKTVYSPTAEGLAKLEESLLDYLGSPCEGPAWISRSYSSAIFPRIGSCMPWLRGWTPWRRRSIGRSARRDPFRTTPPCPSRPASWSGTTSWPSALRRKPCASWPRKPRPRKAGISSLLGNSDNLMGEWSE